MTKILSRFIKEIDSLKNKDVTPENIIDFKKDLEDIASRLENSELSEEEFKIAEKHLLDFVDYLREEDIKKELKKKEKRKEKKKIQIPIPVPISVQAPSPIQMDVQPVRGIQTPQVQQITRPETLQTRSIEIKKSGTDILKYKHILDKRVEDLQRIKADYLNSDIFEYFVDEINKIIDEAIYAFEADDLRNLYENLKTIEQNLALMKDKLETDEYHTLKKEIVKLGRYLQSLLLEKGAKFKRKGIQLKEETIKGRVKKFIKEQKFEGAGGLLFALTDSPLLMILGKQIDDAIGKKREKKEEREKNQLDKLMDIYKNSGRRKKKSSKSKREEREIKQKEDIAVKPMIPSIPMGNESDDEEYKKMISDLRMYADESAKELDLSEDNKNEIDREINKIDKPDSTSKKIETPSESFTGDEPVRKKKVKEIVEKDSDLYTLMKEHIPEIDKNIQKLTKSYSDTNEEQMVSNRDRSLRDIADGLTGKKDLKEVKKEKREEVKKSIKSLIPHIGLIGKIMAGVGAFGLGWKIGKELDKFLGITPAIQKVIDNLQMSLEEYQKRSAFKTMSKEQREKGKGQEILKEKLGLKQVTNKKLYELLSTDKTVLNKLSEEERQTVINRAKAYEYYANKKIENRKYVNLKEDVPEIKRQTPGIIPAVNKTEVKNVNERSIINSSPIVNKSYAEHLSNNLANFMSESSDNILSRDITNKTEKKKIDIKENTSNLTLAKNVDIKNLNPAVKTNLLSMAADYKEKTGKSLPINSAYRSTKQQEILYKKYPGKAAKPGRSMHEKGLAVDINTKNVNELKSTGLLAKYGFNTPVRGETWHIEPTSVRTAYINNMKQENDMSQIGDARTERNVRNVNRESNIANNMNTVVAQNNYIVNPSDFRTFIDDPSLFNEFRNEYS